MELFSYVTCVECGKRILEYSTKCSECGCPTLKSLDRSVTIYSDPNEEIEIDIPAETQKLIEMLTPAILDRNETEKVSSEIRDYIQNRYKNNLHSCTHIFNPINDVLKRSIKQREYDCKQNDFKARVALNTYNQQMDAPVKGMGFSIITNDFISAASYLALSAYDTKKQLVKQEANAIKTLSDNLSKLNLDNAMYESDVFDAFRAVGDAMRVAVKMAQAKQFILSHLDFYSDHKKYNLSKTINGINAYDFVCASVSRSGFVGTYKRFEEAEEVKATVFESAGYIYILEPGFFITTTKLEQETLAEIRYREHPEERAKAELEQRGRDARLCAQAEEYLQTGKYYEAALTYEKAAGHHDSLSKSLRIWDTHILARKWIHTSLRCACAQKEGGTVYFAGKQGNTSVPEEQFLREISQWNNIAQLELLGGMPLGLQENGTIITHLKNVYAANTCILGNGTNWRNIVELAGYAQHHLVGIHSNGRVSAVGINDHGQCNVSSWTDVIKVVTDTDVTMGLKKNGTVLIAGKPDISGQDYQSWDNIVDISVSYYSAVGLTADGRIKVIGTKNYLAEASTWHGIRKVKAEGNSIIGFTNEGRLLYAGEYTADKAYLETQEHVVDATKVGYTIGGKSPWLVLHADGTASASQVHYDISSWKDLVSIGGTEDWAYGVKKDGSVVYTGNGRYDDGAFQQMNRWKLFADINKVVRNPKAKILKNIEERKELLHNEIEVCQKELSNLKGLFTGKKRRELEQRIRELEACLAY